MWFCTFLETKNFFLQLQHPVFWKLSRFRYEIIILLLISTVYNMLIEWSKFSLHNTSIIIQKWRFTNHPVKRKQTTWIVYDNLARNQNIFVHPIGRGKRKIKCHLIIDHSSVSLSARTIDRGIINWFFPSYF